MGIGEAIRNHLASYRLPEPPRQGGPSKLELLRGLTFMQWMMFICTLSFLCTHLLVAGLDSQVVLVMMVT